MLGAFVAPGTIRLSREAALVTVQLRYQGDGLWRSASMPLTSQAAQTVATAARQIKAADEVRIMPSAGLGETLDVRA